MDAAGCTPCGSCWGNESIQNTADLYGHLDNPDVATDTRLVLAENEERWTRVQSG